MTMIFKFFKRFQGVEFDRLHHAAPFNSRRLASSPAGMFSGSEIALQKKSALRTLPGVPGSPFSGLFRLVSAPPPPGRIGREVQEGPCGGPSGGGGCARRGAYPAMYFLHSAFRVPRSAFSDLLGRTDPFMRAGRPPQNSYSPTTVLGLMAEKGSMTAPRLMCTPQPMPQ